jgi:hypothetical protein
MNNAYLVGHHLMDYVVAFLVLALLNYIFTFRLHYQKNRFLLKKGNKIKGRFVRVNDLGDRIGKTNTDFRYNYYKIVVSAIDPQTKSEKEFFSNMTIMNPTKKVFPQYDVYFDPNDANKYYVDITKHKWSEYLLTTFCILLILIFYRFVFVR